MNKWLNVILRVDVCDLLTERVCQQMRRKQKNQSGNGSTFRIRKRGLRTWNESSGLRSTPRHCSEAGGKATAGPLNSLC